MELRYLMAQIDDLEQILILGREHGASRIRIGDIEVDLYPKDHMPQPAPEPHRGDSPKTGTTFDALFGEGGAPKFNNEK
jgi:hypothetical protein